MSLRKVFYSLSPQWRLRVRRIVYWPVDWFQKKKYPNGLPVPPKSKIFTGGGDFVETGFRFVELFKKYGDLKEDSATLDIGSGMGRMALPLTSFLSDNGSYEGIDIMPQGIQWCKENITSKFDRFQFHLIDFSNDLYKTTGASAESMKLPFMDDSFDFIFLISVFTHMLPKEVVNYIKEIHRCLKKGQRCFFTCFVYQDEKVLSKNNFEAFYIQDAKHALMNEKVKSANVAFSYTFVKQHLSQLGLEIEHYIPGKWQENSSAEDFQDIMVISKR